MRIVSGKFKGKRIEPPKNFKARPTTDFAKESLFNIISNNYNFENITALDLFSGTGGISLELASRGCPDVTSVELNPVHQAFIRKTVDDLGMRDQVRSLKQNAFVFLKGCRQQFDLIFADPPYDMEGIETIPDIIFEKNLLTDEGWLILEHSKNKDFSEKPFFIERRSYGSVNFSIFGK
ncbi:RsmD family RNA methyltransferase [Alistipes sp. ZOR0009]|jgi:16S rRNA (guanine(966)-N(2))-methyltransferase RsmD|uniref:RsmD family RNA methyltransferase n=1 Tax=Alistipes sp. ZOR0009 TaxID=1339253 RepID=UPI000645CB71|nr:RsmD family RNA methyltransferase [Alistipes sp. ZOR0009]